MHCLHKKKSTDFCADTFDLLDGRGEGGNFLPVVLKRAEKVAVGEGLCVVQSFEPIPLYSTLEDLGFEHMTDKVLGKIAGHFWQLTWKKEISPSALFAV